VHIDAADEVIVRLPCRRRFEQRAFDLGLAHMGVARGYAVRVSKRDDGGWSLSEIARLPSHADALASIGSNLFAAWSENRVVVFSDKEILGLAKMHRKIVSPT